MPWPALRSVALEATSCATATSLAPGLLGYCGVELASDANRASVAINAIQATE
jgi:hypothetical protein